MKTEDQEQPKSDKQDEAVRAINQHYKEYYDSITDEEMAEEAAWGHLGAEALAAIEWDPPSAEDELQSSETIEPE